MTTIYLNKVNVFVQLKSLRNTPHVMIYCDHFRRFVDNVFSHVTKYVPYHLYQIFAVKMLSLAYMKLFLKE